MNHPALHRMEVWYYMALYIMEEMFWVWYQAMVECSYVYRRAMAMFKTPRGRHFCLDASIFHGILEQLQKIF
jgi:hypothetical protein